VFKFTSFGQFFRNLHEVIKTELTLPPFDARIRQEAGGKEEIFDPLRKKFVALTPEEWVRQHMIHYLVFHLRYPATLISVEAPLKYNRRNKRTDLVVHRRDGKPALIVECKAPQIRLTREVLQQAVMYNMPLQVHFLILTNGIDHQVVDINREENKLNMLDHFPQHDEL